MTKATKEDAQYALRGNEDRHCGVCTMFREPNRCTAVQGAVNADVGLCRYFEKRK